LEKFKLWLKTHLRAQFNCQAEAGLNLSSSHQPLKTLPRKRLSSMVTKLLKARKLSRNRLQLISREMAMESSQLKEETREKVRISTHQTGFRQMTEVSLT